MASSMTTSTVAMTVISVHQGYAGGVKFTEVSCNVTTPDATTGVDCANSGRRNFTFFLTGTYTAPAVGDTFNVVVN